MAYSEKVMDHFQHPRNVGEIENASGVGTVGNAKCGDIMRIFLDIDDETHIIKDCKFKTFGCGAAVATSSMATELVKGKTLVVIAHKLPAIMNADQICVMDHGKLVATGRHQELIQSYPEYQKLWKAAQDSAEWKVHTAKEGK